MDHVDPVRQQIRQCASPEVLEVAPLQEALRGTEQDFTQGNLSRGIALLAIWGPTRKAIHIDPRIALE